MPVAAVVGAAAVGIGGSILSSNAQKKAANKAADVSLQVAQENNALAKDIYGQNKSILSPYAARGDAAGNMINALLGIPAATPAPAPTPTPSSALAGYGQTPLSAQQSALYQRFPQLFEGYDLATTAAPTPTPAPATQPALNPQQAFDIYKNSTGYQFRLGQGYDAINSGYAANGLLQSGAAQKALLRYGQDYGSNEFGNYLGYLSNQQGVGLSGGSALAGVGQNYVNSVSANNNSAGTAQANAAIAKGNANSNMWGGIAGSLGNLFGGSSYGF